MMKTPCFSLIVLCYKNEELWPAMVETVLKQDYPNIQLIVSDDGTPGFDCEAIEQDIRERMDASPKHHIIDLIVRTNEVNQKTVKHVANVLKLVKGEYVILIAADDRLAEADVLSAYAAAFEKHASAQWIVAKAKYTDTSFERTLQVHPTPSDLPALTSGDAQVLFSRWSRRGIAVPCHMAFRSTAFELAGGIDESYTYLEDWPLVLHLLLNGYMPIYLDRFVAMHSLGGVTNSNDSFGVDVRKDFFQDKLHLLNSIAEKNLHLLSPEDRRLYRQYRHEIMDRNYFLQIDAQSMTRGQKIRAALSSPVKAFWLFEEAFWKHFSKIRKKRLLMYAQLLILISALLFFSAEKGGALQEAYQLIGWLDFLAGVACAGIAVCCALCQGFLLYKRRLRRNLVA